MLHPTTFLSYGLLHLKNLKLLPHQCKDTQSKWLLSRSFALQETTNWDTSTKWRSSGLNLRFPWRDDIVYYTWFRIELDRMKEYNTLSLDLFYYDTIDLRRHLGSVYIPQHLHHSALGSRLDVGFTWQLVGHTQGRSAWRSRPALARRGFAPETWISWTCSKIWTTMISSCAGGSCRQTPAAVRAQPYSPNAVECTHSSAP